MAFWIDYVALAILGFVTPYLFSPTEWNEATIKSVKKAGKILSILLSIGWWYGAIPLYLGIWRFDIFENLVVAFLLALPTTFIAIIALYHYLDEPTVFHWVNIALIFAILFLVGWLLPSIVTFVGMVLALLTGKGFRSKWYLAWSDKARSMAELQKYGMNYFMWNGWLNILGLELRNFDWVKTIIDYPMGNWLVHMIAALLFLGYPLCYLAFFYIGLKVKTRKLKAKA